MFLRLAATVALIPIFGSAIGCQPLARVHHHAGARIASQVSSRVILAADFADPLPSANPSPRTADEKKFDDEKRPTNEPVAVTAPPSAPGYTAPSDAIRQLILMTAVATTSGAQTGTSSIGKEFAESNTGLSGAPGLSAPAVSVQSAGVIGPPGLQEGLASALGPISTTSSLFQPASNSLTGMNGGCAALARGGFFQGSEAGCRSFFRPEARNRPIQRTSKFPRK